MAWKPPQKLGDRDPSVAAAKQKLAKYSYGKGLGSDPVYTADFQKALLHYQSVVHGEVIQGKRPPPDLNTLGILDWATKVQLELIPRANVPGPPKLRHPFFVFRGTGGIIGQDYVSLVCQGASDLVEEINPNWPATMGGVPVGTAGGIGDPSMWAGVQIAVTDAQHQFLMMKQTRPNVHVGIGGYSAGSVAAAIFRQWILDNFPHNYLCSFSFGDPTRPVGGGFFGQPAPWGRGISSTHYGDPTDFRQCWLTNEGDMYAQIPGGVCGDIMDDVYDQVTQFAFTDIAAASFRMIAEIPVVAQKAGIALPSAFDEMSNPIGSLLGLGLPLLIGSIGALIPSADHGDSLTGTAAAAKAAVLALTFMFQGTAPHVRYHVDEAWPGGPTFLDLARMHVRDWAARTKPA